ncbi:MAG: hypothetical protein ABR591_06470 [Candidatus Velthaea sp.]
MTQELLLVGAVAAVGVLHTMVPDHWAPIALLARAQGWPAAKTAQSAAIAGVGHTVSTLLIAIVVWTAGVAFAQRFGHAVSIVSSLALIGFGFWIVVGSWREIHAKALADIASADAPPKTSSRTALLLIVGSSPMVEGIPAFFAAARFGATLLAVMSAVFALTTIATYVALCVTSAAGLQRLRLGALEQYGEVLSGTLIAAVGVVFLVFPAL